MGDVEAGAKRRFADVGLGWEPYEGSGFSDGLLRWYLTHGDGTYAA